jgi:hypothetical protein
LSFVIQKLILQFISHHYRIQIGIRVLIAEFSQDMTVCLQYVATNFKQKVLIGRQSYSIIVEFFFDKRYLAIVIIVLLAIIVSAVLILKTSPSTPFSTPCPLIDGNVSSLGSEGMNVTQGSTLQVNVTLTSFADQKLTVPIENLKLAGFNNTAWDNSLPQNELFNYTFSNNELILQPYESKFVVLTLEVAEDAPLVQYLFYIELGNWEVTHFGGIGLTLRVAPKL